MKQRNRSPLEIRCDILSVLAERPQRKTWILYKANLNLHSLQRHLTALIETELISETVSKLKSGNRTRYVYYITPQGIDALNHYRLVTEAFENPRSMKEQSNQTPVDELRVNDKCENPAKNRH